MKKEEEDVHQDSTAILEMRLALDDYDASMERFLKGTFLADRVGWFLLAVIWCRDLC